MSLIFRFTPLDTLFFRGNTPMEAGLSAPASLFPPPVSVLKGAIYTHVCRRQNISFEENLVNGKIPFDIEGFFIEKKKGLENASYYVKAPVTWYYDSEKKLALGRQLKDLRLVESSAFADVFSALNIKASAENIFFARAEKELQSLSNAYVSFDFMKKRLNGSCEIFKEDSVLFTSEIYTTEKRTGVALDSSKQAKEGQLYSASHIRLNDGVSFCVEISESEFVRQGMGEEGSIKLGGEGRISRYENLTHSELSDVLVDIRSKGENFGNGDGLYFSTISLPIEEQNREKYLKNLVASDKFQVFSGWDLKKGFHKDSVSCIPAGAVFNADIDSSCLRIN